MIIKKMKEIKNRCHSVKILPLILLSLLFSCEDELGDMISGKGGSGLPDVTLTGITAGSSSFVINWTNPAYDEFENVELECNGERYTTSTEITYTFDSLTAGTEYTIRITTNYSHNRGSDGYVINTATTTSGSITYKVVCNAAELAAINTDSVTLAGDYLLIRDIDLSDYQGGSGWTPIGDYSNKFTGTFDGSGHTISNLVIHADAINFVGLFGCADGAEICNVNIKNANIIGNTYTGGFTGSSNGSKITNCTFSGSVSGSTYVGGFTGDSTGSITNSYSAAVVTATGNSAGGLTGRNNNGTVSYCFSAGSVSGNQNIGGLAGVNGGNIKYSYSTCNITNKDGYAGGLVGRNDSSILYSYSTGSVSGTNYLGGLVGYNGSGSSISNCYSKGNVSGSAHIGGLAGYNTVAGITNCYSTGITSSTANKGGSIGYYVSGTLTNVFWNSDMNTAGIGIGSGTVTGLTTTQMKDSANVSTNYSGWNFSTIWNIDGSTNSGYPFLRNMP